MFQAERRVVGDDGEEGEDRAAEGLPVESEAADGPAAPPARRFRITDPQKWLDLCA
jgi:hypothetical protein